MFANKKSTLSKRKNALHVLVILSKKQCKNIISFYILKVFFFRINGTLYFEMEKR